MVRGIFEKKFETYILNWSRENQKILDGLTDRSNLEFHEVTSLLKRIYIIKLKSYSYWYIRYIKENLFTKLYILVIVVRVSLFIKRSFSIIRNVYSLSVHKLHLGRKGISQLLIQNEVCFCLFQIPLIYEHVF